MSWTAGAGLWLTSAPGTGGIDVVDEGTEVTLLCWSAGPAVTGPYGTTTIWDRVVTPDGHIGYQSDAYLATGSDSPVVPHCD